VDGNEGLKNRDRAKSAPQAPGAYLSIFASRTCGKQHAQIRKHATISILQEGTDDQESAGD
jgi:hypothetical protein